MVQVIGEVRLSMVFLGGMLCKTHDVMEDTIIGSGGLPTHNEGKVILFVLDTFKSAVVVFFRIRSFTR